MFRSRCSVSESPFFFAPASFVTRILQKLEMPILDVNKCDEMYHNDSSSSDTDTEVLPKDYRLIYDDMICAGYPEGKKDSCQVKIGDKSHGAIMTCSRYYL